MIERGGCRSSEVWYQTTINPLRLSRPDGSWAALVYHHPGSWVFGSGLFIQHLRLSTWDGARWLNSFRRASSFLSWIESWFQSFARLSVVMARERPCIRLMYTYINSIESQWTRLISSIVLCLPTAVTVSVGNLILTRWQKNRNAEYVVIFTHKFQCETLPFLFITWKPVAQDRG